MTKKLIIKLPRKTEVDGRRITLSKFEKHLINAKADYSTQFGQIKKEDLKKTKVSVGKEEYLILTPSFIDHYKKIKRLAQIITLKDIGSIITGTGMTRDSIVMDAGSGSGGLACFMASICKKVISYDNRREHSMVCEENAKNLNLKTVEFKAGDIYDSSSISEKNEIDVLVLDNPEPHKAVESMNKVLKVGGFVVAYTPNITQNQEFVKSLPDNFLYEKTIENIEREWTIKDRVLRPKMKDIGHTAFLSFARKVSK